MTSITDVAGARERIEKLAGHYHYMGQYHHEEALWEANEDADAIQHFPSARREEAASKAKYQTATDLRTILAALDEANEIINFADVLKDGMMEAQAEDQARIAELAEALKIAREYMVDEGDCMDVFPIDLIDAEIERVNKVDEALKGTPNV